MKRFAIVLLALLSLTVYATLPTVTATLYVVNADGTFPSEAPDTTAEVTYATSLNPNPIRYSPVSTYTAATGAIVWTVPQNSYLKVGCSAVIGMTPPTNFAIATDNVVLNDMISSTPPSVTSVNSFVTIDCPSGTDPVADTAIDTLTLTAGTGVSITGTASTDTVTIANTSPDQTVALTGAGITTCTGTYPNFTITSTEADTLDAVCERDGITDKDITSTGTVTGNVLATTTGKITSAVAAGGTLFTLSNTTPSFTSGTLLSLEPDRSVILDIDYLGTTNHRALSVPNIVLWNSSAAGTLDFLCDSNQYTHKLSGNPRATGDARFYLPVDEPAVESLLTMGPDGEIDFDPSVYLTAEVDGSTTNEIQNLFATITPTTGDPCVADTSTDTLTLTAGTGITLTGVASSDTITIANTAPDQTVAFTNGTGISVTGTYPNFTVTNSAPDQTVAFTNGGITAVTGTYPNFTITSTEADTLASVTTRGATTDQLITLDNGNTSAGRILFLEDSSNGSNGVTLSGAQSTDDVTVTLPSATGTIPLLESANTWTAAQANSYTPTASTPALMLTGALMTGGTGTTNFPNFLIQPTVATAATDWSTSGTAFGVNLNEAAGNFVDLKYDGTTKFKIDNAGVITAASGAISGAWNVGATSRFINGLYTGTGSADAKRMGFNYGATVDPGSGYINYEGATADDNETTVGCVDPTVDNTVLFPDESGTLVTQAYGEMYAYENTTALAIGTVDIYHAVGSSGLVTGLVNGFTFQAGSTGPISAFADYSGTVAGTVLVTDTAHGLLTGDIVTIDGTTNYNGTFSITKVDDNTYYITDTWVADDATGNWTMGAYLKASKAGVYRVGMSLTAHAASANKTFKFEMMKGITNLDNIAVSRAFAVTDYTPMSATGLVTLAVDDRLWLAVMNQTDAVDITIRHINVNVSKL